MARSATTVGVGALATLLIVVATLGFVLRPGDDEPGRSAAPRPTPSTSSSPPARPTPTIDPRLLPNMRSLGADDLQIEDDAGARLLRFAASLANVGPGPLLLTPRPRAARCPDGQLAADQLLHHDTARDGVFQRRRDPVGARRAAGCMLDHPDHDHWHFDAMASYTLRSVSSGRVAVSTDKVSFCLRDNERVRGAPVVVRREYFGECEREGVQGISPGWVDVYTADLSGQALELPAGAAGRFCLELAADPFDLLLETDETDNATAIPIRIDGFDVGRLPGEACAVSPPPAGPG